MKGKFFYHGTDLNSFMSILDTGEIKCRRLIEKEGIKTSRTLDPIFGVGYNGYEYISLCQLNNFSYNSESAYRVFVRNHYCFIISNEINAVKTVYVHSKEIDEYYKEEFITSLRNQFEGDLRFSNMQDEWQVRNRVSLNDIVGIGIPFNMLQYNNHNDIQRAIALAEIFHLDIVDTSNFNFIEKYESEGPTDYEKEKMKKLVYERQDN